MKINSPPSALYEIREISKDGEPAERFRRDLFATLQLPPSAASTPWTRKQIYAAYGESHSDTIEEIYKFSQGKWERAEFDQLLGVSSGDGPLLAVSGAKLYKNWLRAGMHHHVLRPFRKTLRSFAFRDQGFMQAHVEYAQKMGCEGVFYSIFPYNSKLKTYTDIMRGLTTKSRLFSPQSPIPLSPLVEKVQVVDQNLPFNGVEQFFFYIRFNGATLSTEHMRDIIS